MGGWEMMRQLISLFRKAATEASPVREDAGGIHK